MLNQGKISIGEIYCPFLFLLSRIRTLILYYSQKARSQLFPQQNLPFPITFFYLFQADNRNTLSCRPLSDSTSSLNLGKKISWEFNKLFINFLIILLCVQVIGTANMLSTKNDHFQSMILILAKFENCLPHIFASFLVMVQNDNLHIA